MTTMHSVTSSNVSAIGYDYDHETLAVEFKNRTTYEYLGVPLEVYAELVEAESVGSVLNSTVKGQYQFRKVM